LYPPLLQLPAAVHAVWVAQDTSRKELALLPEGLGVLCRVQLDPLKRYARVDTLFPSLAFFQLPTTVQALGDDVQETSFRLVSVASAGSARV
jgi:hypothetical protein